jgi:hypothetical protein
MLFIHQQIQSFLNLGGCKEYPTMARPKSPKTNLYITPSVRAGTGTALADPAENRVAGMAATSTGPTSAEPDPSDEIRRRAYLLSEQRGFEPGHETEDWLNAEREVLGR